MAQADVDRILEGLKIRGQQIAEHQRLLLEQERNATENEYRQKALDAQIEQHKATTKHQEALLKATQAYHKVQSIAALNKMSGDYSATGTLPPNTNVSPGQSEGTSTLTFDPSTYGTHETQIPGIGSVESPMRQQVATPQAYTKLLGEQAEAKEGPRRTTQGERLETQADLAQLRADQAKEIQKLRDDSASQRLEDLRRSVEYVANQNNITRESIANIRQKGLGADPELDLETPLQRMRDGSMSLQDVKRTYVNKKDQDAILKASQAAGIVPLDDKQKLIRAGFATASEAIPLMHQYVDELQKNGISNFAPNSRARQLQGQIGETLAAATSALNRAGARLSDRRVAIMERAFLPRLNIYPGNLQWNINNVRDFESLLRKSFKESFPELPKDALEHQMTGAFNSSGTSEPVLMTKPDGTRVLVHPADVDKAKAAGYK